MRESEIYGDTIADQTAAHERALGRQKAVQQSPQEIAAGPEQPTPPELEAETSDSILSWASGDHFVSAQPGDDIAFDARIAGVDGAHVTATPPFSNVRAVPDCSEGQASGVDAILRGGRRE